MDDLFGCERWRNGRGVVRNGAREQEGLRCPSFSSLSGKGGQGVRPNNCENTETLSEDV